MTVSKAKQQNASTRSNGPRLLNYHELKPALIDRFGTPKLNIRTGGVHLGDNMLNADEVGRFYLELCSESEQWPIGPTSDAIWAMAEANRFDPVAEALLELADYEPLPLVQWERLDKWLLGIDNPIAAAFLTQYFIGAVARVMSPGCEARCSPVLVGPQQRGKTTLGRIMFGDDFWVEGLSDLSKDSRMRCQTAWAVELSELDGITRRSDVESLKTFLTEREDSFRKPYGKGIIKTKRSFIFWGTANRSPLRDLSGNSRFLCIGLPDQMLPLDWALANRKALWARAVEQFSSGTDWRMVSEEERSARIEANSNFDQIDPWREIIHCFLGVNPDEMTTFHDLYKRLEVGPEKQNTANARRIKEYVEAEGWEYAQRRPNYSKTAIRAFWKPEAPVKAQEGEGTDLF